MMRKAFLVSVVIFVVFALPSCERGGVGSVEPDITISGYRIEGRLVDGFQRPLVGVQVLLYYDLIYLSSDSVTRAYTPLVQGEVVTVEVKDLAGTTVRTLFSGPAPQDSNLFVAWDQRDGNGIRVQSGIYETTYTVANQVRKSFRQIVDGNQNAVSDSDGRFVIPESDFPVGDSAAFYDSSDVYFGEFEIADGAFLRFVTPAFAKTFYVTLLKNKITYFPVVLS